MEFRQARSTKQALDWLAECESSAQVIAGGTDVMMQHARGDVTAETFVHIEGVPELSGADLLASAGGPTADLKAGENRSAAAERAAADRAAASRFGALVTHRWLATDPRVRWLHPALGEAAGTVGGWQTQSVGTLGGNICNASPAADTVPPLLVADAVVELQSAHGMRRIPLTDFFLGRRATARSPDELVTAIEAQPVGRNAAEVYLKAGRRGAMVVAVVGLAVRLTFDTTGRRVTEARVALCSVAPTPVRARATERALVDGGGRADSVKLAGQELLAEIAPIDDARGSAAYRRMILPGLLERAVATCWSRVLATKARPA